MTREDTQLVKAHRTKRSASDTRALMLEVGQKLLFERLTAQREDADGAPLAFIRVSDVAREATKLVAEREAGPTSPVTTGSIYQLWPSQNDYQAELVRHLIQETTSPASPLMKDLLLDLIADGANLGVIFDRLLELSFSVNDTDAFFVRLGFLQHSATASIAEALRTDAEDYIQAQKPILEAILSYSRRRIRAPYSMDQVVLAIEAIVSGFLMHHRVDSHILFTSLPPGSRTLLATTVEGAFLNLTEPADTARSGDLPE